MAENDGNSGWSKAGKLIKKAANIATETAKTAAEAYEQSDVKRQVDKGAAQAKEFLDEKGVTAAASTVSQTASETLDTVSGAKTLQIVEERLELQKQYNDILACKLDEALDRIASLEKAVFKKK